MSFEVRMKKRKKIVVLRVMCVVMVILLACFLNWELMREYLMEDGSYLIFLVLMGLFVLLFAYSFYIQSRPRIEVDGQDITFYPLWRPSRRVAFSEITGRKEKPDYYDPKQAAVAGALGGGLLAWAVTKRNASTMEAPKAMIYTYFRGSTKLITVSTREMENVERFDQMVVDSLEGRPLTGVRATAELEPADKGKALLLAVGAIAAVCVLAVGSVVLFFRGGSADAPKPSVPSERATPELREPAGKTPYSTQGVTFEISSDWTQAEGSELFYTDGGRKVYGLNGVSALGSYAPREFLEELVDHYRTTNQFTDLEAPEELTAWKSSDGVECQVADLTGYKESVIYCTRLVIAPRKNLVLTFCGQAYQDQVSGPDEVWDTLDPLCESLTFEIGTQDEISGNTFLCGDGSQLCLQDDGGFRYYQSAEDHEKPYYEGVYEVYYGQAAMDKAASMTEYGLTMEELERVLSASMNGYIPGGSRPSDYFYSSGELEDNRTRYDVCLDTFYAVILHNQRLVSSPEDVQEGGNSTLYIGFYLPELKMADLTNCNAASHTQWTFQKKTA